MLWKIIQNLLDKFWVRYSFIYILVLLFFQDWLGLHKQCGHCKSVWNLYVNIYVLGELRITYFWFDGIFVLFQWIFKAISSVTNEYLDVVLVLQWININTAIWMVTSNQKINRGRRKGRIFSFFSPCFQLIPSHSYMDIQNLFTCILLLRSIYCNCEVWSHVQTKMYSFVRVKFINTIYFTLCIDSCLKKYIGNISFISAKPLDSYIGMIGF